MLRNLLAAAVVVLSSGCAYHAAPVSAPAVNIVSNFSTKIPGRWALVISDDVAQARREVRATSHACSAHTYPISAGQAFDTSIRRTVEAVFESVVEPQSSLTIDALKAGGYAGQLSFRLSEFTPRISCAIGFWSGTCTANVEVGFAAEVRNSKGAIVHNSSTGGSKSSDGNAGGACEGGSAVLADATSRATKDALERMAERLSNATGLRP